MAPMIQIVGQVPVTTTLTLSELMRIFPVLRRQAMLSHSNLIELPPDSMTYRGLEGAIRWMEHSLQHPGVDYELDLMESVEMYHAMYALGVKSTDALLQHINRAIIPAIQSGLDLDDIQELWALRRLAGTAPFIRCLVCYLARLVREAMAELPDLDEVSTFEDSATLDAIDDDMMSVIDILTWVETEEELTDRIMEAQRLEKKCEKDCRYMRKYGYRKKVGAKWIAKSAVQCAKMLAGLETIEEDQAW